MRQESDSKKNEIFLNTWKYFSQVMLMFAWVGEYKCVINVVASLMRSII